MKRNPSVRRGWRLPTTIAVAGTLLAGFLIASAGVSSAAPTPADLNPTERLLVEWPGPYGGLPPVDHATPANIEAACLHAIATKRQEVAAIVANPAPPTFENTIAALDASGLEMARIQGLLQELLAAASSDDLRAVAGRVLPLWTALEDETAFDPQLFRRIDTVFKALPASAPTPDARRLVVVMRDNMVRRGASLELEKQAQLKTINARIATLITQFGQNLTREEAALVVYVDDVAELKGLKEDRIAAAKTAAVARGQATKWAIPMQRPSVWPVLTSAESRPLRERVFRLWESRGNNRGPYDNAPVMKEILQLRGERAKLFGYSTYAHYATAPRMVGKPETAAVMLERAWELLLPKTQKEIANLQKMANREHAGITLAPWDKLYYAEKYRQEAFGLDAEAVRPYLALQNVVDGMMWAAESTYGLKFKEIHDAPVLAPEIRVYEVSRDGEVVGVLYLDLFQRTGKGPASWTAEYQSAVRGPAHLLPVVTLHSNVMRPLNSEPPLLAWEVANVLFHEFGHALHMLSNRSTYRALGSTNVPWDFVEVPSLLNERWLLDRKLLLRFARHYQTGAPMPLELIDKVERSLKHDRVFSVNLEFLATALVDLRLHLLADGRSIDAVEEEKKILAALKTPAAIKPLLPVSSAFHTFTEAYSAGVYTYLWSDAIAADIAEAYLEAPGGFYDQEVAARYRRTILDAGNTQPMQEAFREFRGHDPDPDALFRRFDLLPIAKSQH